MHIRFLIFCVKFVLWNHQTFIDFGSLIFSRYHRPYNKKEDNQQISLSESEDVINIDEKAIQRYTDIIHGFIQEMINRSEQAKNFLYIQSLQMMLFNGILKILNDDKLTLKTKFAIIDKICKSFSMSRGLAKLPFHYFEFIVKRFWENSFNNIQNNDVENMEKNWAILPCSLHFIRRSNNTDRLSYWEQLLENEKSMQPLIDQYKDDANMKSILENYQKFKNQFLELIKKDE